jgi:hypothetical protein
MLFLILLYNFFSVRFLQGYYYYLKVWLSILFVRFRVTIDYEAGERRNFSILFTLRQKPKGFLSANIYFFQSSLH